MSGVLITGANNWFLIPKRGFECEHVFVPAGRLVYLQKNQAFLTNHGVHDGKLDRVIAWCAEHGHGIDMTLNIHSPV